MGERTGPGPTLRTVLQALNARGYEVGLDDDGHSMLVVDGAGRRSWLGYGPVMRFVPRGDDVDDAALAVDLNAFLDGLPEEWAPAAWREVGVEDADLAWQLERSSVRPGAYVLDVKYGAVIECLYAAFKADEGRTLKVEYRYWGPGGESVLEHQTRSEVRYGHWRQRSRERDPAQVHLPQRAYAAAGGEGLRAGPVGARRRASRLENGVEK